MRVILLVLLNLWVLNAKHEAKDVFVDSKNEAIYVLVNEAIDVHFWLYNKDNQDNYEDMVFNGETIHLSEGTVYDPNKMTKLVVHGWNGKTHIDKIFNQWYADAGLDYNVVGVDWRDLEGKPKDQVVIAGQYAAHFVESLVKDHGVKLEDIHPIGWSYGAHVVANIGKEIIRREVGKLRRITCLDPGEYGFQNLPEIVITKQDAEFVDVIHTDAGQYGFLKQLGHADFYPSGGMDQPCSCDHSCPGIPCGNGGDHRRAPDYFQESILSWESFPAWRCLVTWDQFLAANNSCPFEEESVVVSMGEWADAKGTLEEGFYFLKTNNQSPFSCEEECFLS